MTLSIPNDPALIQLDFYVQAMVLDPMGPNGIAATPGAAARIGAR